MDTPAKSERDLRPEAFLPDRVIGVTVLIYQAIYFGLAIFHLGSRWLFAEPHTSLTLFEWMMPKEGRWLMGVLLAVAAHSWFGLGIYHGRRWSFVVQMYVAAATLLNSIGPFPSALSLAIPAWMRVAIYLSTFIYCGLRMFGAFGPFSGNILDFHDVQRSDLGEVSRV